MTRVCVIDVVGLTPRSVGPDTPRIASVGRAAPLAGPLPAVTCVAQATMLTGAPPAVHGIVGNGWLHRDTMEVRFWQQSNRLIQAETIYASRRFRCAQMFWWFNQGAPVDWYATPKPHYGADGSKVFDIIDATGCDLQRELGPFPFFAFWGPGAGLPASEWIARASAAVLRRHRPDLTLVYLPHLDYDHQRRGPGDARPLREVDACAGIVIDAAREIDARVVVVSEYGLVPVSRAVPINRVLREAGWLAVRDGPFGEMLDTFGSKAFAVADHQVAHVYVEEPALRAAVRERIAALEGVDRVVEPREVGLGHPRSGELVALAEGDAWFAYPYWLDDERAPDFARTVDIHRKPGYDPCELFMTSKGRAIVRLIQKRLGFRYRMDVIPLDPSLARGSHGVEPADPRDGAVIVTEEPDPPTSMAGVKAFLLRALER
ncbi:MAG: alkaline phosphatase family protein [Planctomycetes bacterium]|nr:alkaline phosphatase family protein [Planctomycetota bacterium]